MNQPSPPKLLFRAAALERMASPEQLDRTLALVRPASWVGLLVCLVFAATTVIWSLTGRIATRVEGEGILLRTTARITNAMAPATGILDELRVKVGDFVTAGQLVGRLSHAELHRKLINSREVMAERQEDHARLTRSLEKETRLRTANFDAQTLALGQVISASNSRHNALRKRVAGLEQLAAKGIITLSKLDEAKVELYQVEQSLADSRAGLARIEAERLDLKLNSERALSEAEQQVAEAAREVRRLETEVQFSAEVLSPIAGQVIEIKAQPGTVVAVGASLAAIEEQGEGLSVLAYFAPDGGKNIRVGMVADVIPTTIKAAEVGTLRGRIATISQFPVTSSGMRNLLDNDELVRRFSAHGAPYQAVVELTPDPEATSGYRWSSGHGPAIILGSGTLARTEVVTRQQRPIELLMPLLSSLSDGT